MKPRIVLSRTSPKFLERLFEQEIPEVADGLIIVKRVERIPGEKAKVAVESYDERIDPVGACVGMKGSRIHGIVRELGNENIDVINYTSNTSLFISRALSPAKVSSISGYEIDVYRDVDDTEDVALTEFVDEIDGWIIDELKNIGCDTAKSVLELSAAELVKRTDLEEETIKEIQAVLKSEFED